MMWFTRQSRKCNCLYKIGEMTCPHERRHERPPYLHHHQQIRKVWRTETCRICCHGWDMMLKISQVAPIGVKMLGELIFHSESWPFIPVEQWAFITSLYIITPVYQLKKPVTLWNTAKKGFTWTSSLHIVCGRAHLLLAEISIKEEVIIGC